MNLPSRPLFDPDEGRYAEIPREMAASGDWVTPTLNGLPYFEKPPLQYWATSALYSLLGVHDWTSRVWAAGLAFLCLPLVFGFTLRLGYSRDAALVGACLLAVNPYFAIAGQLNLLDQAFTFFLTLAIFSFSLAQREHAFLATSRNWMLLTWASLALAVLSKGIVTLVLAGTTLIIYLLVTRDASPLRRLHVWLGLPLFLAITVPWFLLVQSRNPDFARFFFIHEHFERFLTTTHDRVKPWWYFLPILLIAMLPFIWNIRDWRLAGIEGGVAPRVFRVELLLLIWCCVIFVLFSFSQSKLSSYIMPMMPVLAALMARVTHANAAAFGRAKATALGLVLFIAAGLMLLGWRGMGTSSEDLIIWTAVPGMLCIAYLVFERLKPQANDARRWVRLAAFSIAAYQLIGMSYAASVPSISSAGILERVGDEIHADTRVYCVAHYRHTLAFALRRPLAVYAYVGELELGMRHAGINPVDLDLAHFLETWQRESRAVAFIHARDYAAIAAQGLPGRVLSRDAESVVISRR